MPPDLRTTHYLEFLQRLSVHPLARQLGRWQLNDPCVGVIVARLLKGCKFPDPYAIPAGEERVAFARVLAAKLRQADPARIWRETAPTERPVFD